MSHPPRTATYVGVYRAVRRADHGRVRALRCCLDVRRGSWTARDVGEMRAQIAAAHQEKACK